MTLVDLDNPVSAAGVLRLWRAYASQGGRAMLKVYRPEGDRLVLVGTSPLVQVPPAQVAVFECRIPVARNDLVGCFCPDDTCLDVFADGLALVGDGDAGTRLLETFVSTVGGPSMWAGTSDILDIPSTAGTDLVVPVVGRTPGLNDTQWSTTLELFNTATSDNTVALLFNLSGQDNTTPAASAQLVVPARQTLVFEDLLAEAFELVDATGSLDVLALEPVIAHARVANLDPAGTYGQIVPAVPARWAPGDDQTPGVNLRSDTLYLFELREDQSWRCNIGVVNTSAVALEVELTAYQQSAEVGETLELELEPFSHIQVNRALLALGLPFGSRDVRVNVAARSGSQARFLAYASRVDNQTGDAVLILGAREPAL